MSPSSPTFPRRYDFVEVEDISETSTIVWGRWCGQSVPPRLTSKTNTLKVSFKSDDYFVAKPGFKLHFSLQVSEHRDVTASHSTKVLKRKDPNLVL